MMRFPYIERHAVSLLTKYIQTNQLIHGICHVAPTAFLLTTFIHSYIHACMHLTAHYDACRFQSRSLGWLQGASFDEDESPTAQTLLSSSAGFLAKGSKNKRLSSGKVDIMRLVDANINDPSNENISSVNFHPSGELLLAAGEDKYMRLFKIDGDKNEKILGVKFSDMSISNACFRNSSSSSSDEVVVCGRKPFFYAFDLKSGKSSKVPGLMGKSLKSHETMCISPGGGKIAFAGAAGYTHICDGKNKTWVADVKVRIPSPTNFLEPSLQAYFSDEQLCAKPSLCRRDNFADQRPGC